MMNDDRTTYPQFTFMGDRFQQARPGYVQGNDHVDDSRQIPLDYTASKAHIAPVTATTTLTDGGADEIRIRKGISLWQMIREAELDARGETRAYHDASDTLIIWQYRLIEILDRHFGASKPSIKNNA